MSNHPKQLKETDMLAVSLEKTKIRIGKVWWVNTASVRIVIVIGLISNLIWTGSDWFHSESVIDPFGDTPDETRFSEKSQDITHALQRSGQEPNNLSEE